MPQLFTVRWPLFARLEALLLFPVSLILASEIAPVRTLAYNQLIPSLSPYAIKLGIPPAAIIWAAMAIIVILPFFAVLLVADRFLTVRKGYATLSLVAIAIWAATGLHLSDQLAEFVPDTIIAQYDWLPFDQEAALAAGCAALVLHLWPLWSGLRDQGEVAANLIDAHERRGSGGEAEQIAARLRDVYYRQTADFRGWQTQEQLSGLDGVPKESSAVKVLYAVTWIGVLVAIAAAHHNWGTFTASKAQPSPDPRAAPPVVGRMSNANPAPVGAQLPAPLPAVPLSPGSGGHVVVATAMPTVNRPTELPSNNAANGPNEAVADRGSNGGFAFDAVVNGGHVAMMFDTGASIVALRAEDAERLGINMAKLNYSAKVKTANGTAEVAPVVIDTLTVGNITLRSVVACVAKEGTMQINLLGQTFLARLSGFNVENNQLVLRGR
jgi:clan AA aspartic protease (TIGR02281 family)